MLGVDSSGDNDVDVVTELRKRLEAAGLVATSSSMMQQDEAITAAVAAETAKYESTIAELKTSNESLKTKLKAVNKASQDAKQRHAKDVSKLQKIVAGLKTQQQQQQQQQEQEQQQRAGENQTAEELDRAGGHADAYVGAEVGAAPAESRSAAVLPPLNVTSPQSRPLANSQTTSTGDHEFNSHSSDVRQSATHAQPPSSVVMPPLVLPKSSSTSTARARPPTTAVVLPSLAVADTSDYAYDVNEYASNALRSQVSRLAMNSARLLLF